MLSEQPERKLREKTSAQTLVWPTAFEETKCTQKAQNEEGSFSFH